LIVDGVGGGGAGNIAEWLAALLALLSAPRAESLAPGVARNALSYLYLCKYCAAATHVYSLRDFLEICIPVVTETLVLDIICHASVCDSDSGALPSSNFAKLFIASERRRAKAVVEWLYPDGLVVTPWLDWTDAAESKLGRQRFCIVAQVLMIGNTLRIRVPVSRLSTSAMPGCFFNDEVKVLVSSPLTTNMGIAVVCHARSGRREIPSTEAHACSGQPAFVSFSCRGSSSLDLRFSVAAAVAFLWPMGVATDLSLEEYQRDGI
jgi:hypothetical protein